MRRVALLIPQGAGLTAVAAGFLVLLGSVAHTPVLNSLSSMTLPTAICLVLAGASLFLSQSYPHSRRADRICWILSLGICFVALASLVEVIAPLRMPQATAVSLCLIAAALVASRSRTGLVVTLAAAFFSGLALIGYVYGIKALYNVGPYQSMALHTAACLFFLCVGILFSERHHGLGRLLFGSSASATITRRLLPGAVIVPTAIGILIVSGQAAGWYPEQLGLAVFAVSLILAQMFFVVWVASYLAQVDRLREAAETAVRDRQAQLAQSEERLQRTLNAVSAAIFEIDLGTREVFWSDGFHALFGRDRPATYDGWMAALHPEDRERALPEAYAGTEEGEVRTDYRVIREGEIRWIEATGRCMGEQRFAGLIVDVTERRRAEEELRQYRDIFQFTTQALSISIGDQGSFFHLVNPAFARLHGYAVEELIGAPIGQVLAPSEYNRLQESIRISNETGSYAFEAIHVRKDGAEFPVAIELTAAKDQQGKVLYRIAALADITERRRMEERLRETAKLESIGVLAGGIAHDFNNILTGILGNASLLTESLPSDSPTHETATFIINASERAADLVRQMLAYSGKGQFILTVFDLSSKIRETSALIAMVISRSANLAMHLAKDLPPIEADAVQIQQVIMNLIINAAEALGGKTGQVTVMTSAVDIGAGFIQELNTPFEIAPGRYVLLEVEDNGCGMDTATVAKIFDPFFTTKFTGRGLGLSAVLGIVRGHKGILKVRSQPGAGTAFQVYFPAVSATRRTAAVVSRPIRGKGTVLVVDDEDLVRQTASAVLRHAGFDVLVADGGERAIEVFRSQCREIDLVLLDLSMPQMNGEETLRRLQAVRPEVTVILSSGYAEADAIRRFEGKHLAGYLQKPYDAKLLAETVVRVSRSV